MGEEEEDTEPLAGEAMLRILKDKLEEYGTVNQRVAKETLPALLLIGDLKEMLKQIPIQMPWDYTVCQAI